MSLSRDHLKILLKNARYRRVRDGARGHCVGFASDDARGFGGVVVFPGEVRRSFFQVNETNLTIYQNGEAPPPKSAGRYTVSR